MSAWCLINLHWCEQSKNLVLTCSLLDTFLFFFLWVQIIRACDGKNNLSFIGRFGDFGVKDASDWISPLISAPDCKQILSFQPCLSKQGKINQASKSNHRLPNRKWSVWRKIWNQNHKNTVGLSYLPTKQVRTQMFDSVVTLIFQ